MKKCVICNETATFELYNLDIELSPYCKNHVPIDLFEHVYSESGYCITCSDELDNIN